MCVAINFYDAMTFVHMFCLHNVITNLLVLGLDVCAVVFISRHHCTILRL